MLSEAYTITVDSDHIAFELFAGDMSRDFPTSGVPAPGYAIVSRMGDPELLECIVWRDGKQPGGAFVVRNEEILFVAFAESNLAYALGLAYFGQLVANARYGADIFENMGNTDD